jgi:hypothetical protein
LKTAAGCGVPRPGSERLQDPARQVAF